MSLHPHALPPVPQATAAAVEAAFPRGNLYVDLRAEFGSLYTDELFADLYPPSGRPVAVLPWRLARVLVMQYIEGLTDRQAGRPLGHAVRRCRDWKYALSLEIPDPGFDFTLLHDFRVRLLQHAAGQRLRDTFLLASKARDLIKSRGVQERIRRMCWQQFAASSISSALAKPYTLRSINCVRRILTGSTRIFHLTGVPGTDYAPSKAASRKTRPNGWPSPRQWAPMAINSLRGLLRRRHRPTSARCQLWRSCVKFGSSSFIAVPFPVPRNCTGVPSRTRRPLPNESNHRMIWRRATAVNATPTGWGTKCM